MLKLYSKPVELRGVAHKTTKAGKLYYVLNVESEDGSPHGLYCPDASVLPQGLKKGDMISVEFDVHYYGTNERPR